MVENQRSGSNGRIGMNQRSKAHLEWSRERASENRVR
jgi:hypothetical protein